MASQNIVAGRKAHHRNIPGLSRHLFGLDFPNPVGLAAGYDKNAQVVDAMLGLGFGFVEAGTVTPRPQPGNPRPRLFRLTQDEAVINRFGFNSQGHGPTLARLTHRASRKRGRMLGITGVNIGANKDSEDRTADYVSGYRAFAPVADYITVNISSPNTPGLRDLQSEAELAGLLTALHDLRQEIGSGGGKTPPILLKIAPDLDLDGLTTIVETAVGTGVDGLIISNTTITRPHLTSRYRDEAGGLSGKPLFSLSTAMLARAFVLADGRLPLVGVGGVASAQDALDKITAGASLVQLYSALVYEGPALARRINDQLPGLLMRHGFADIAGATGARAKEFASAHLSS